MITYEWDLETFDPVDDEVLDHHHGATLNDVPWPVAEGERLVLVRDDDSGRYWAYVDDESRMLPAYFSIPGPDGEYYETNRKVPQRFHREIARAFAGARR